MSFAIFLFALALTYLRPIEAYAPELVVYRPMLILLLLTFAIAASHAVRARQIASSRRIVWVLLGFAVVIPLSIAAAGWSGGAILAFVDFAPSVLFFFSTVMLVTTTARLRTTCATLVACMTVLSVFGAVAFHTGYMADKLLIAQSASDEGVTSGTGPDAIPANDTTGRLWRVRSLGFLSDPNDFGQAIVVALPMLLAFHRRRAWLRNMVFVVAPGAVMLYGLYLTHSRGAVLGLGSALFLGIQRRVGTIRTILIVGLATAAMIALNFSGGRAYTANEESAGGRIDAWGEGLRMLVGHPLLGVGYREFTSYHPYTAHDSFVLCFAETGLIGYFLWLGLIVLTFKQLNRAAELAPPQTEGHRWSATLRASLLGFLTCAIFLSRAYEPGFYLLLGIAGSGWYCARRDVPTKDLPRLTEPAQWRRLTALLTVGSITAFYLIVIIKNSVIGRTI